MGELRRASESGRWASLLRSVALVAVLAIASCALLPLAHGSSAHVGDCGVCTVLVHGGANVVAGLPTVASPFVAVGPELEIAESVRVLLQRDFTLRLARAPPFASVDA